MSIHKTRSAKDRPAPDRRKLTAAELRLCIGGARSGDPSLPPQFAPRGWAVTGGKGHDR
jgi:hypothetical protein